LFKNLTDKLPNCRLFSVTCLLCAGTSSVYRHALHHYKQLNTVKPSERWQDFEPPLSTFIEYQGKQDSLLSKELESLPGTTGSHNDCTQRNDADYFHGGYSRSSGRYSRSRGWREGYGLVDDHEFYEEGVRYDPVSAHSRTCTFCTVLPPYVVLDLLERHGYKLVGTNIVERTCIWTLHKPAETENRA